MRLASVEPPAREAICGVRENSSESGAGMLGRWAGSGSGKWQVKAQRPSFVMSAGSVANG